MSASSLIPEPADQPFSLIVTADDFGIGLATSRGIIDAHLHGPVTATSMMTVTGDHVRASVPLLQNAPNLEVGLHITLTRCGEKPLMARQSSGLVGRDDQFLTNGQLWRKAFLGKLDRLAVAEEITAQTERFHKLLGRAPAYVDSHHHVHQLPVIRDALLEVMGHDLLPRITRLTIEPPGFIGKISSVRIRRTAAQFLGRRAAKIFSQRWLWSNDYYFGMLSQRDLRREFPWEKYLKRLPMQKNVEWIVHPGQTDETLVGRDDYIASRTTELAALASPAGQSHWEHLRPYLSHKSKLQRTPPAIVS